MDTRQLEQQDLIHRYLRDELTEQEASAFEVAVLESPELQDELEAAMAVQHSFKMAEAKGVEVSGQPAKGGNLQVSADKKRTMSLPQWSLAASVVIAAASLLFFWQARQQIGELEHSIASQNLARPGAGLTLPVMRAGSTQAFVVQRPASGSIVNLGVEVAANSAQTPLQLAFMTVAEQQVLYRWNGIPDAENTVSKAIDARFFPVGRVWLVIRDADGELLERRLLEFVDD